jgi:hypothetical protein
MSAYLYGIVAASDAKPTAAAVSQQLGAVVHRNIAALYSPVRADEVATEDVRILRRHAIVARGVTVLPFAFGTALPDEDAVIRRFLAPQHARLLQALRQVQGQVEMTVKANYLQDRVLSEVVAQRPELASSATGRTTGAARRSYQSKIELGRRIAQAIEAKRQLDAKRLLAALSPVACDMRSGQAGSDLTVLSASFLVRRRDIDRFDRALEQIAAQERSRIQLDCVGPLPPYSFSELRL